MSAFGRRNKIVDVVIELCVPAVCLYCTCCLPREMEAHVPWLSRLSLDTLALLIRILKFINIKERTVWKLKRLVVHSNKFFLNRESLWMRIHCFLLSYTQQTFINACREFYKPNDSTTFVLFLTLLPSFWRQLSCISIANIMSLRNLHKLPNVLHFRSNSG